MVDFGFGQVGEAGVCTGARKAKRIWVGNRIENIFSKFGLGSCNVATLQVQRVVEGSCVLDGGQVLATAQVIFHFDFLSPAGRC